MTYVLLISVAGCAFMAMCGYFALTAKNGAEDDD